MKCIGTVLATIVCVFAGMSVVIGGTIGLLWLSFQIADALGYGGSLVVTMVIYLSLAAIGIGTCSGVQMCREQRA